MTTLILDTASENSFIAFVSGKKILFHFPLGEKKVLSEEIFPLLEKGFKTLELSVKDLHSIAVNIGPGSFTGTRVGVMIAKTFAFACNLPVATFKTGFENLNLLLDELQEKDLTSTDKISPIYSNLLM